MSDPEDSPSPEAAALDDRLAIGISFGNSYSSIAHTSSDGTVDVIANEEGDRQIPSILSYTGGDEFHGTQAKAQLVRNNGNTIAYFRDFIGKDFKAIDPTACHASAHAVEHGSTVAFTVQEQPSEEPSTLTVSEVTTRHLRRLAASASDYLGKKVNAAVIAVPTDMTDAQRETLVTAARDAGLEVLQLINEPVAAVLAYDARQPPIGSSSSSSSNSPAGPPADKLVVVADLGGTRSDAAAIASRGGIYTILATAHEYGLGGAQLDQVLVDFFAKDFAKKHKTDPRDAPRSLAKLKLEAEAAKKALSLGTSASLSIESLADGIDFSATINRLRYELLANKVFTNFTQLVERVVQKAELDVLDIDEVILSGGTSHTPKVARMVQALFPPSTTVLAPSAVTATATSVSAAPLPLNPSELAVRGAAIQASLVQDFDREDIAQSSHPMVTVTPHLSRPIGVQLLSLAGTGASAAANDASSSVQAAAAATALFWPLLEAETAVPARRTAHFPLPAALLGSGGGDILVRLCEGIREIRVTKPERKSAKKQKAKGKDGDERDEAATTTTAAANGAVLPDKADGAGNNPRHNATVDDEDDDDDEDEDGSEDDDDNDEDDDDDDDEEEGGARPPKVQRERVWKIGTVLAEAAVRGVGVSGGGGSAGDAGDKAGKSGKAGGKDKPGRERSARIEVMVHVGGDLSVQFTARQVGGSGSGRGGSGGSSGAAAAAVRGVIDPPRTEGNGSV